MFRAGSLRKVVRSCCAALAATVALGVGSQASAQIHGVQVGKSCTSPRCVGENTDCLILIGHGDGFGDTIRILDGFDIVDPTGDAVRVPAAGNLPIVSIEGNAQCTDSGGVCDQSAGVNCGLPCIVGPANSTLSGLPGDPQAGIIRFRQNTYVIQANDPSPLQDQANVNVMDLCDSPTTGGCSSLPNLVQFTASTTITRCTDEECQVEACLNGVCSSTSICTTDPAFCDDVDVCTEDVCNDDLGGCCENTPIDCPPRTCFDNAGCDPDDGCQYTSECLIAGRCDDSNICTSDVCDESDADCCINTPVPCPERSCFDIAECDPVDGCQYISECTDPNRCNDNNVCTSDVCNVEDPDCCVNTTIPCPPRACFNNTGCDPVDACQYQSVCDADPAFCDDDDPCTQDTCDTEEEGCCVHTDICVCGDGNIDPGENCDGTAEASGVDCTNSCDAACTCCGDDMRQSDEQCDGTQFEPDAPDTHGDCRADCTFCGDGTVNGGEACDDGNAVDTDSCSNACTVVADFAGCTPGFWKQPQHLQYWPAGYLPGDHIDDVFGVDSTNNPTLLTALSTGGGGEIAFLRHAVSALLNSAHGDVDYAYSTAQVIAMVQAAYASGDFATAHALFAAQNELGCTVIKTPRGGSDRLGGTKKK